MTILEFLYALKDRQVHLYLTPQHKIGFKLAKNTLFSDADKATIKDHQQDIIAILALNHIYNATDACACEIYQVPAHLSTQQLESVQKSMLLQSLQDACHYTYHVPLYFEVAGYYASSVLAAMQAFLSAHPALCMQVQEDLTYTYCPVSSVPISQHTVERGQINELITKTILDTQFGFDTPLIRPQLLTLANETDRLVIGLLHHHLLSDEFAAKLMVKEILVRLKPPQQGVPTPGIQFSDYQYWQQWQRQSAAYREAATKLAQQLDTIEGLKLRTCNARNTDNTAEHLNLTLAPQLTTAMKQLALQQNVSLYAVLVTALMTALRYFSAVKTFALAITVSHRSEPTQHLIGPCINTLPLLCEYDPAMSVATALDTVSEQLLHLNEFRLLSLDQIMNAMQSKPATVQELFPVLFTLHNAQLDPNLLNVLTNAKLIHCPDKAEKFGMSFYAAEQQEGIEFDVCYAKHRYAKQDVQAIIGTFYQLLQSIVTSPVTQALASLPSLTPDVYQQYVACYNQTQHPFSDNITLSELFVQQVARTPTAIAVACENRQLTYQQLHEQSNQLAHFLLQQITLNTDTAIGVCLERGCELLVTIHAILKAGAAYVPLDPSYPTKRIEYIIADSQAPLILTGGHGLPVATDTQVINLFDPKVIALIESHPKLQPAGNKPQASSLAYILYTSGTTGKPKGVMLEHQAVVNRIEWMQNQYPLTAQDVVLQKTPVVFDVSVWELFWANWYGASIFFAKPEGHKDPDYLFACMQQQQVTVCHFVPSMLQAFFDVLSYQDLNTLPIRLLFCSGEALPQRLVQRFLTTWLKPTLHNLYGPTEAAIDVTSFACVDEAQDPIFIGKPIQNIQLYVLNEALNPVPVGGIGELYIGGVGLARGYHNLPELTQTKFIIHPTLKRRLYQTGDLVRMAACGNIEYIRRIDAQIKLNGFRIELGEIEQVLLTIEGIRAATVQVVANALVAYYVAASARPTATMSRVVGEQLPPYMVPAHFVQIAQLPVTANGKLDRKALPVPCASQSQRRQPEGATEQAVLTKVRQVLSGACQDIAITDDFFQSGGDSISAIRLVSLLRQSFNITLSVKQLYQLATLENIAKLIDQLQQQGTATTHAARAEQGQLQGAFELLPIQAWFMAQAWPKPAHWNQAFTIQIPPTSLETLQIALIQLVRQHDSLNVNFGSDGSQYYHLPPTTVPLISINVQDVTATQVQQQLTQCQAGFDLSAGPLYCFAYLHGFAEPQAKLFIACHHLVIDAVSWQILRDDLQTLLTGGELAAKTSSVRQWTQTLTQYASCHTDEVDYWDRVLSKASTAALPLGQRRSKPQLQQRYLSSELSPAVLQNACLAYQITPQELLLTAMGLCLKALFDVPSPAVLLEGHGREHIDAAIDLSRTTGWFTSLFPIVLPLGEDLKAAIIAVKNTLRQIPNAGLGFGALKGYTTAALPGVVFNYLGTLANTDTPWSIDIAETGTWFHPDNPVAHDLQCMLYWQNDRLVLHTMMGCEAISAPTFNDTLSAQVNSIVQHCLHEAKPYYVTDAFREIESEADLTKVPLLADPDRSSPFPMTQIQKAYLLGESTEFEIGNVSNHIYQEFVYQQLDVDRLQQALSLAIAAQPTLRTVFCPDTLTQRYLPIEQSQVAVTVHDCRGRCYARDPDHTLRAYYMNKKYAKTQFPLFDFAVSQYQDVSVLHVSIELIVLDVHSRILLFQMLSKLYKTLQPVPQPRILFKDYMTYFQQLQQSAWYQRDKAYWQAKIQNYPLRPSFNFLTPPETVSEPQFSMDTQYVATDLWLQFKSRLQAIKISPAAALLCLYSHILCQMVGRQELLITLTLFNRYPIAAEVEQMLGDFTSTILYHYTDQGDALQAGVEQTFEQLWEHIQHGLYSGVEVQRDLAHLHQLDIHSAVSPIVFTCFVSNQDQAVQQAFLDDSEIKSKRFWGAQTSQAWMDLQAVEVDGQFMSKWLYVEQLFAPDVIQYANKRYCELIEWIATHGFVPFTVPYLLPQQAAIINTINYGDVSLTPPVDTIVTRIATLCQDPEQCLRPAVFDGERKQYYTYADICQQSYNLAQQCLSKHMTSPLIAVLAEKSVLQVVATLGIMQSGHAYLPLHTQWPPQRSLAVLQQAGCEVVLVSDTQYVKLVSDPRFSNTQLLKISMLIQQPATEPVTLPTVAPEDTAYVIFTSGTTGKPKGVTIAHAACLNTLDAINQQFAVTAADSILAVSDLSFDLSVYDIFGLLLAGGRIIFPDPERAKDVATWTSLVAEHKITLWNSVPQLADLLIDELNLQQCTSSIRLFLLSGDWIPLSLPDKINQLQRAKVVSLGGATEGSIWSIWYPVQQISASWNAIPYGVAMPNQAMFVLSPSGAQCPIGINGEIHIGGMGVAKGYWNDAALTNAKFIVHPTLGRLYKTGDMGRYHADGYIEFLGRLDFQVKIRGYRVELEDIKAAILSYPGITQAEVVYRDQQLVGYLLDEKLEVQALTEHLQQCLPDYMVPTTFVCLTEWPLSANGKLDRSQLPLPNTQPSQQHVAPRNEIEATLCDIWADLFQHPAAQFSVEADFFKLGGDSILNIRLINAIRHTFQVNLSLNETFKHTTIASLATVLASKQIEPASAASARQPITSNHVPHLLPNADWFFHATIKNRHYFNMACLIQVPSNKSKVQQAITQVLAGLPQFSARVLATESSKPSLRMSEVAPQPEIVDLHCEQIEDAALQLQLNALHQRINIDSGPLYSLAWVFAQHSQTHYLFLAVHHLVCDAISLSLIRDRLKSAYLGQECLMDNDCQAWVQAVYQHAKMHHTECAYWQAVCQDLPVVTAMANDEHVPHTLTATFSQAETCVIQKLSQLYQASLPAILLAGLISVLEVTECGIMLEAHGRETISTAVDPSQIIGWFTAIYPIRLRQQSSWVAQVAHVEQVLADVPHKGLLFGPLVGYNTPQLPNISFNYLGLLEDCGGEWGLSVSHTGAWQDPDNQAFDLSLVAYIKAGQLYLNITTRLAMAEQSDLLRRYQALLRQHSQAVLGTGAKCQAIVPISGLQQGFIYQHLLAQANPVAQAYKVQMVWHYYTHIDATLLHQAWQLVQTQFPALRSAFVWETDMQQVIHQQCNIDFATLELVEEELAAYLQSTACQAYELTQPGLLSVRLLRFAQDHFCCVVNIHHLIIDGWSGSLLLDTVHDYYLRLRQGQQPQVVPDDAYLAAARYRASYAGTAIEPKLRQALQVPDAAPCLAGLMQDAKRGTKLRQITELLQATTRTIKVPKSVDTALRQFCQQHRVTLSTLYHYVWHLLLSTYGNAETTCVGLVLAGRTLPIAKIEQSVGLYLTTVPTVLRHRQSLLDVLSDLQQQINQANESVGVNLANLTTSQDRLFESLFIFENYPKAAQAYTQQLKIVFESGTELHDYPLTLAVKQQDQMSIELTFDGSLFVATAIEALLATYGRVLAQLPTLTDNNLDNLNLVASEYALPAPIALDPAKLFFECFCQNVSRYPDRTAIKSQTVELSYQDLMQSIYQLVAHLHKLPMTKGAPIGICLPRNEKVLVAMLACMHLGSPYVPIHPEIPISRIESILSSSQLQLVITVADTAHLFKVGVPTLLFDELPDAKRVVDVPAPCRLEASTPIYIIYTSGTTGTPNGIQISHRAFAHFLHGFKQQFFSTSHHPCTLSVTHYVFDIFGLEYGLPLMYGGYITLSDLDLKPTMCAEYDFMQFTPQIYRLLASRLLVTENTVLLLGGEAVDGATINAACERYASVINVYGPTEATIWSTAKRYTKQDTPLPFVSIGQALPGETVLVLDNARRRVPPGGIGELYLAGMGLADGYVNNPALTAQKFFDYPGSQPRRLYQTGDQVRLLFNGEIEYLQRVDFQVKVNGHRIECQEIEAVLQATTWVSQAVVLVYREADEPMLVAFVQLNAAGLEQTDTAVIQWLVDACHQKLPHYMHPSHFVRLENFPTTVNGKLDRRQLYKLFETQRRTATPVADISTATTLQLEIAAIWAKVLKISQVDHDTNFFDLGGNSMRLIKLHAELPAHYRDNIRLIDLFKYATVNKLARHLQSRLTDQTGTNSTSPNTAHHKTTRRQLGAKQQSADIAIIGMSGRFPGANSIGEFWQNLVTGTDTLTHHSRAALTATVATELLNHPNYVTVQAKLDNIFDFDAGLFGFTDREALVTDPQHRIFLECAWEALESANYDPFRYTGEIGIYAGCGQNDYYLNYIHPTESEQDVITRYQNMLQTQAQYLATKVAYKLNLMGPAVTVQTACSTSLVAVHQACQALLTGDCDMALAGAISVGQLEAGGYLFEPGMIFSPDGRCRPFDEAAQGTFEGQGVGIVVLKPLAQALQDADQIMAVIKGTAINNDGQDKIGFTAPSVSRQAQVLQKALARAQVDPGSIGYIEAHATGTPLGDPIEVQAIQQVYGSASNCQIGLGSVKSNIGHLDVAAGMAGLIKAVLCLQYQQLVPTQHMTNINTKLELDTTRFYIPTKTQPWPAPTTHPQRTAVSAFGVGGTNAHLILEAYPTSEATTAPLSAVSYYFHLSAHSKPALLRAAKRLREYLLQQPQVNLLQLAYTLDKRRARLQFNYYLIANNLPQLLQQLATIDAAEIYSLQAISEMPENVYPKHPIQCMALPTYCFDRRTYKLPRASKTSPQPSKAQAPQQTIKQQLCQLWRQVLELNEVDCDSDFFQLGGDSLAAIQVQNAIKRQFDKHIELIDLECASINHIVARLEPRSNAQAPIVCLQAGAPDAAIPLVLIHPIGGDVYFYRELVEQLPTQQSVYAIRSPILAGVKDYASITAMSQDYLKLLAGNGHRGPMVLAGASFGGIIAFEMAQCKLAQLGQQNPVVMIDTPCYGNLPASMSSEEILTYLMQYGLESIDLSPQALQQAGDLEAQLDLIAIRAQMAGKADLFDPEFLRQYLITWQRHSTLMQQYQPKPYPGAVQFFSHIEVIPQFPSDQYSHWQQYFVGQHHNLNVPGHHISMNAMPHVAITAKHIATFVARQTAASFAESDSVG